MVHLVKSESDAYGYQVPAHIQALLSQGWLHHFVNGINTHLEESAG